ncbi:MAG TPA: sugar phosphate isomerase/epimerase family protein [Verrucomicrobiae bacterium]
MQTAGSQTSLTRREFVRRIALGGSAVGLCGAGALASEASAASPPSIVVFSKIFQEIKLNYEDAAALTAEAGLDGIDCPVRPGGEVLPERVADDLPRYAEALRKHGLKIPLLTTAITSTATPHAELILKTGKQLGATFYRLGFVYHKKNTTVSDQIAEARTQLKDLAGLNRQIGIGALLQNHSPSGSSVYLAGDLSEMRQLVEGFEPGQIGVAFDIGHALIVHGDGWRAHFEALRSHLKIAYIKDATRRGRWTPFGQGEIGQAGYFKLLKQMNYQAPFSMHIEYDWADPGNKSRATLLKVLRESSGVLRRWLAEA